MIIDAGKFNPVIMPACTMRNICNVNSDFKTGQKTVKCPGSSGLLTALCLCG